MTLSGFIIDTVVCVGIVYLCYKKEQKKERNKTEFKPKPKEKENIVPPQDDGIDFIDLYMIDMIDL